MMKDGKSGTVSDNLRERIRKGEFGTRGRIPSVTQLSKEYEVARQTIYDAFQLLQADGLIIHQQGSYRVNYPIMRISGAPLFDKFIRDQGLVPVTRNIVEPEIVPMPAHIAAMFGMQPGASVIHRARTHGTADDVVYRLAETWYPVDLAGQFLEAMRENPDMNVAGEIRKTTGVSIANWHHEVIARLPTREEAGSLHIIRTIPIMDVRRKAMAFDGRIIFVSNQVLVGAYFRLEYDEPHHRV